jgi:hypothetical protein
VCWARALRSDRCIGGPRVSSCMYCWA